MARVVVPLLIVVVALGFVVPHPVGASPSKPNILVLLLDDADRRILFRMPNVRRHIIDRGANFLRFYVTQSQCCPARSSILTGEYVHNHDIRSTEADRGGGYREFRSKHEDRTIAALLEGNGYTTGYFGKYFNRYGPVSRTAHHEPPHWDRWTGLFVADTEDGQGSWRYDYRFNQDGRIVRRGDHPQAYVDRVVGRHARRWISGAVSGSAPVFAVIAPLAPHPRYLDINDPPAYQGAYRGARPPALRHPSFDERDVSDKPRHVRALRPITREQRRTIVEDYRHRLRMVREIDDLLGRLVVSLRERGELHNTYIVVTSDNGWLGGQHRIRKGKLYPYRESVRLPLFVRGPGVVEGSIPELTSLIDLYPTFADIATGGMEPTRDGRSLLDVLRGQTSPRDSLLIEHMIEDPTPIPNFFGVVTQRWKYIEHDTGERELYDLRRDPRELRNRYGEADRDLVDELQGRLEDLKPCRGDGCREADS